MPVPADAIQVAALSALAVMLNVAATLWATGVAMRVRSVQGAPLIRVPVMIILFLSAAFVPLRLLTGWRPPPSTR